MNRRSRCRATRTSRASTCGRRRPSRARRGAGPTRRTRRACSTPRPAGPRGGSWPPTQRAGARGERVPAAGAVALRASRDGTFVVAGRGTAPAGADVLATFPGVRGVGAAARLGARVLALSKYARRLSTSSRARTSTASRTRVWPSPTSRAPRAPGCWPSTTSAPSWRRAATGRRGARGRPCSTTRTRRAGGQDGRPPRRCASARPTSRRCSRRSRARRVTRRRSWWRSSARATSGSGRRRRRRTRSSTRARRLRRASRRATSTSARPRAPRRRASWRAARRRASRREILCGNQPLVWDVPTKL